MIRAAAYHKLDAARMAGVRSAVLIGSFTLVNCTYRRTVPKEAAGFKAFEHGMKWALANMAAARALVGDGE
jgi:hypothetical protein